MKHRLAVSRDDRLFGKVKFSRPRIEAKRHAVDRDPPGPRSVLALFFIGGPTAIDGRIVTIIVDAFKRVFRRRPRSHISQKPLERTSPRYTDLNPASAIARIKVSAHIFTSGNHPFPHAIFRRSAHAVCRAGGMSRFLIDTATTSCMAASQSASRYLGRTSAIAAACPVPFGVPLLCFGRHVQAAESLTNQGVAHV